MKIGLEIGKWGVVQNISYHIIILSYKSTDDACINYRVLLDTFLICISGKCLN